MSVSGGYVPCACCGGFSGEVTYGFINIRDFDMWEAGRDERSACAWRIENNSCICGQYVPRGITSAYLGGTVDVSADPEGMSFKNANLVGVPLDGPNLKGADLRGSNFAGANLRGSNLRQANLREANLTMAALILADLTGAKLYKANLREANLRQANLRQANLAGANLKRADLREADLTGANLVEADLTGAIADKNTVWPEGFDPVAAGVIFE
jgi:uncharacterized protein YjbI with pentapeptide repeats